MRLEKWSVVIALVACSVLADSAHMRDGRGRAGRGGASNAKAATSKSIESALAAGDKAGNWWALKADGTMLSGSALTMAAQGSPGVSPITLNGTSQFYKSANVAYPTGDFSFVCVVSQDVTSSATTDVINKFGGTLVFTAEDATSGADNLLYVNGASALGAAHVSASLTTSVWQTIGGSYTSATGAIVYRVAGVDHGATAVGGGVTASTEAMAVGANTAGSGFFKGQMRGCVFTEKVLSSADIDRIGAGAL